MRSSVITSEETVEHFVENYRFKVLLDHENGKSEQDNAANKHKDNQNLLKQNNQTESQSVSEAPLMPPIQSGFDASFVEELLKKTDELSSNIIKLQMQIENQESEFNKRLEAEIARAKDDGIALGVAQEAQKFQSELNALNERFNSSILKLANFYNTLDEFLKKNEDELANAAINVAREVISKEVSASSSNVAFALSKSLMQDLKDAKNITIRVNPDDAKFLSDEFSGNDHIKIESDDAISRGGVVIISEVGNIDAKIETRLEKLKRLI